MKTLKTALSLLLMLCMLLSLGTVAFADDDDEGSVVNEGNINNPPNSTIDVNLGTIYTNNGTVIDNLGTIQRNNEAVTDNNNSIQENYGTVTNNNNTIQKNYDTVTDNYGSIEYVGGGIVENNHHNVYVNAGTVVTNCEENGTYVGTVNGNFGTIGAYTADGKVDTGKGNFGTVSGNYPGEKAGLTTNGNIIYNGPSGVIGEGESYNKWELGNFSAVDTNDGKIVTNGSSGTVKTNNNIVETNAKNGIIENNSAGGYVGENNGQINTNAGDENNYGLIDVNNGNVTDNHGFITINTGTVEENYGEVVINYGGTVNNKGDGSVDLQYYGVEITTENTSDPVKTGFEQYENKDYLLAGATGTVTVAPKEGIILDTSSVTVENGSSDGLTVETNGSGLLLTFKNLLNNLKLKITGRKNDPKPDPKPKPASAAADLSVNVVSCTFDLAGGTLDGETGKVVKWFVPGATVKLPAAPTKPESTFAGWQTKVGDEVKVFQAGDKFTVTAAQDFTALWD